MKREIFAFVFGIFIGAMVMARANDPKPKVMWMGFPMNSETQYSTHWEIGMREDGVVVWRERKWSAPQVFEMK